MATSPRPWRPRLRVTRISVLAVTLLVAGLLGAPPALAADPAGVVALSSGSTSTPVPMEPLTRTTHGVVWRQAGDPYLWVKAIRVRHLTFPDAQSAGDLLSHYDASTGTFVYLTIPEVYPGTNTPHSVSVP